MSAAFPLPLGYTLHVFDVLHSTMEEAHTLASKGAPAGTIVLASQQMKGRGRFGRPWISLPGNLSISIVLYPQIPLQRVPELGFVLAIAVGNTLMSYLPASLQVRYKWPNDILLNGCKIAGLLLETEPRIHDVQAFPQWTIAGIGVNITNFPPDLPFPTTSLAHHKIFVPSLNFLSSFCLFLDKMLRLWREEGFLAIQKRWLSHAWGVSKKVVVHGSRNIQGSFYGLSAEGAFILEDSLGVKHTILASEMITWKN